LHFNELSTKPFLYGFHHKTEPVQIQKTQDRVGREKEERKPHVDLLAMSFCLLLSQLGFGRAMQVPEAPHVAIKIDGLVPAPADATTEEARHQEYAVDKLHLSPRESRLIQKPMHVEKRRRKLVQHEVDSVIIGKRALLQCFAVSKREFP
jgi:hypothetical protein